jgi:hypothetical protein
VTNTTTTTITLSWQPPSFAGTGGLASYNVSVAAQANVASGTNYTVTGLASNTTYTIQVSAVSNLGLTSGPSNSVSGRTLPAGYPFDVTMNEALVCKGGCGSTRPSTFLNYVTVNGVGRVDLHLTYSNPTSNSIGIITPGDQLTDTSRNYGVATGGTNSVTIPANGSADVTISFSGLSPAPGTQCTFASYVQELPSLYETNYQSLSIPCR